MIDATIKIYLHFISICVVIENCFTYSYNSYHFQVHHKKCYMKKANKENIPVSATTLKLNQIKKCYKNI